MSALTVTKETAALLAMVYRSGAPRFHELTTDQARRSFEKLQFAFGFEREAVAFCQDVVIHRDAAGGLLARLYRPLAAHPGDVLPLIIYFHGGGWCIGDVASYDGLCRRLANQSRMEVLSVDYRLAPEHPFPLAFQDATLAVEWACLQQRGSQPRWSAIELAGDSAGGTLVLASAHALRGEIGGLVKRLVTVYPCVEMMSSRASRTTFADGFMLDSRSLDWFFFRYLDGQSPLDWRASPLLARSLAGLPPITMVTAGLDPLTDDCVAFVERVLAEGGAADRYHVEGVPHGFLTLGRHFPEAQGTLERVYSGHSEAELRQRR